MTSPAIEHESPRLYSRPSRIPSDEVAEEHDDIHFELERWGRWHRERYRPGTCASIEKKYYRGGREATPPSTAPEPTDPSILAVDRAYRHMLLRLPRHARTLALYYIKREQPIFIAKQARVRRQEWQQWIGTCRSMIRNIVKELA